MSRVTRLLKALQNEAKSGSETQGDSPATEYLDMSSIEKASFLQEEEYSSFGNPLHSTALEDQSRPEPDQRHKATAGKPADNEKGNEVRGMTETPKTPAGAATNRKAQPKSHVRAQKKKKGNQKPSEQTDPAPRSQRLQTISESRNNKGKRGAQSKVSNSTPGRGSSATDTSSDAADTQSQRLPSLSSVDLTDEDESFHPSTERHTASGTRLPRSRSSSKPRRGRKQKRKSSGSSGSGNPSKKQKPGVGRNPIALDVVFEAFQEFVTQYKETVSSEVVKKAINALSHSFEEDLTEKIAAATEFSSVKREALKVNRTLNQKKARLLEIKNELIKSKVELKKLEKEHSELEQRLAALKQGTALFNNLKTLHTTYRQHRSAHSEELETYGPCCMPAMLLEARNITGKEQQLKNINEKLQHVLGKNAHKEHSMH